MIGEVWVRGGIQANIFSSDTRIAHCVLCLAHISSANEPVGENRNIITSRFFVLLERYLASPKSNQRSDSHSSKQQLIGSNKNASDNFCKAKFPVCDECFKIVEPFCDLYNEVSKLELKLDWEVWKLKSTMASVDRLMPSRMTSLREFYVHTDKQNEIPDQICNYRQKVIRKCTGSAKLQKGFPRVSLENNPTGQKAKNTSSRGIEDEVAPIDSIPGIEIVDVLNDELLRVETDPVLLSSVNNIPSKKFSNISDSKTNSQQFRNARQIKETSAVSKEACIDKGAPPTVGGAEESSLSRSVSVVGTFQVPILVTNLNPEPFASVTIREESLEETGLSNTGAQCWAEPMQAETEWSYQAHSHPPSASSSYNAQTNPSYPSAGNSMYSFSTGNPVYHHSKIPFTLNMPTANLLQPVLSLSAPIFTCQSTLNSTTSNSKSMSNVPISNLRHNLNTNHPDKNTFTSARLSPGACPSRGLDPKNCECCWCKQYRRRLDTAEPRIPENIQEQDTRLGERRAYFGNHGAVSNDTCITANSPLVVSGRDLQQSEQSTVTRGDFNAMNSASINKGDDGGGCSYNYSNTKPEPESSDDDDDDSEIDYKGFQITPEAESFNSDSNDDTEDEELKFQPREKITTPADVANSVSSRGNQSLGRKDGFTCPLCPAKFGTLKKLVVHFLNRPRLHSSKEVTVTRDHYAKHKISVACIQMEVLNSKITNEQSAANFEQLVLERLKQLYPCKIKDCFEVFPSPEELDTHSKLHGEFKCTFCDVSSDFAPDLAIHEWQKHSISKSKETDKVSTKLRTGDDGGEGLSRKTNSKFQYQCPRCSFRFNNIMPFVHHHLLEHMELQMNMRSCNICKHEFMQLSQGEFRVSLDRHVLTHHNLTDVVDPSSIKRCDHDQCSAFFLTVDQLNKHNIHVHQNSSIAKVCNDCGKVFPGKRGRKALRRHRISKHNAELKFHCSEAGCKDKHFEIESDLFYHMQAHRIKHDRLKCPQCGRACLGKSGLKNHIKFTHTQGKKSPKQRKFVCEHCGKAFKEKETLEKHYLSHSGPGTWEFMCSVCSKKCLTKQKLNEHMRTHTKEQPFVCQYCGVKYAHRHNLRIHVNNKHADVDKDIPRPFDRTNLSSKKGKRLKKSQINEECSSSE